MCRIGKWLEEAVRRIQLFEAASAEKTAERIVIKEWLPLHQCMKPTRQKVTEDPLFRDNFGESLETLSAVGSKSWVSS